MSKQQKTINTQDFLQVVKSELKRRKEQDALDDSIPDHEKCAGTMYWLGKRAGVSFASLSRWFASKGGLGLGGLSVQRIMKALDIEFTSRKSGTKLRTLCQEFMTAYETPGGWGSARATYNQLKELMEHE